MAKKPAAKKKVTKKVKKVSTKKPASRPKYRKLPKEINYVLPSPRATLFVHLKSFLREKKGMQAIMKTADIVIRGAAKQEDPVKVWQYFCAAMSRGAGLIRDLAREYRNMLQEAEQLREDIALLENSKKKLYNFIEKLQTAVKDQYDVAYFSEDEVEQVRNEVKYKQHALYTKTKEIERMEEHNEKLEKEIIIKQEELEEAIHETNLARSEYYRLTDDEMELFEVQRPKILKGIEKWGNVALALRNDATITMRASSILYYAKKHKAFGQDIEIAKQVFRERVDAEMIDRAFNGTKKPIFQKGEYIGDYAIRDDKVMLEVAKAKLPQEYNPKLYAAANPKAAGGTTINIVSFDGVDETKHGYAKNIGVVQSVDDTGKVKRITQKKDAQEMLEFYKNKPGAEIIEAELVPSEEHIDEQQTEDE